MQLAAFTATLAVALQEDEAICAHFPAVYRWIAEQSPECEVLFAKYATRLLGGKLAADRESMQVLHSAAKKLGRV